MVPLSDDNKHQFQQALLGWFKKEGRTFPWRFQTDPYSILVAEKLLQQSIARDVLVQAYGRLLQRYPTPLDLSRGSVSDVEEIVRPLGFIYRARELITMAQELVERHKGEVPRTLPELMALTGVGEYGARAVLSFAYGEDVPVVDTNVARFLFRIFGIEGPLPANPARKKVLNDLAANILLEGRSKEFNLAILDLCALICKPTNPLCPDCPVQAFCVYGTARMAKDPHKG
jgi:A/G-specific adenine glycosylase